MILTPGYAAEKARAFALQCLAAEKVAAAQAGLAELEALDQTQERLKAEAQEATRARNDERRAVANWMADYQKIARIALADRPDLAEPLGLTVPSEA